tara:strand:+ start:738 stop:1907 length:1170 start_codon:yes stop_codon:yes gene_type:complete
VKLKDVNLPEAFNGGPSMADKRDYYEVLGVDKSAGEKELKNAFRSLARKYHPDRSSEPDAEDKFKEIQEAYAVLSDDEKRQMYDRYGHNAPGGSPFGGFGGGSFNINLEDILGGDFFSSFFGGNSRRTRNRGNDIIIRYSINLESVYQGTSEELTVELPTSCVDCNGSGAENGDIISCSNCGGQGKIRARQQVGPFVQDVIRDCPKCSGMGQLIKTKCKSCNGDGQQMEETKLRFNIPKGADDGTRLRMRGKGEPALRGRGENGDLFIELEVEQHDWFERSGADLIMSLPLPYEELVLGVTITLPHIDGTDLKIVIPKMTNSGETIEIRGKGLPRLRGSGRGDVVVLVKLQLPEKVSKSQAKHLESNKPKYSDEELETRIKQDAKKRRQ